MKHGRICLRDFLYPYLNANRAFSVKTRLDPRKKRICLGMSLVAEIASLKADFVWKIAYVLNCALFVKQSVTIYLVLIIREGRLGNGLNMWCKVC